MGAVLTRWTMGGRRARGDGLGTELGAEAAEAELRCWRCRASSSA